MDAKHRKHLQRNYVKLHQNIANIKAVVGSLYSSGILTDRMKSEIMGGHKTDYGRIGKLLDILPLRGPDAFLGFLHALEENGEIAADIIREGLQDSSTASDSQQHIPNSAAIPVGSPAVKPTTQRWNRPLPKENDELPKTWPLCVHVVQVRSDDSYMLDKFDQATKGNENMYTMRRISPRGVALIINNRHFDDADLDREGSQYDEVSLDQLFTQLGYKTVIMNDCKAEEMRDVIKAQAQADHRKYDSFVCAVMSHGNEGKVYGVDGYAVDLKELIFRMESCKSLSGKPKLFFIQACQGTGDLVQGQVDDGVREDTTVKELLQSSLVPGKVVSSAKGGTAVTKFLPPSLVPGKVVSSAKGGKAVTKFLPPSLVQGKVVSSVKDGTASQQSSLVTVKVDGSVKDDAASQQSSLVTEKVDGSVKDDTASQQSSLVTVKVDGSVKDDTASQQSSLVTEKVDGSVKDDTASQQSSLVTEKVDGSVKDDTASQQSTDSEGNGIPFSSKTDTFVAMATVPAEGLVPGEVDDGLREDTTVKELLQSSLVPGKVVSSAKDGTAVTKFLPPSLVPGKVVSSAKDGTAVTKFLPPSLVPGKVVSSAKDGTASQESSDSDGNGIPFTSKTDTFVAMATVPDFMDFGNIYIGSWFIQAVVYVFSHLSHKYDLNSLMSRVNRLVSRDCDNHGWKQVSIHNSTLTKDFFFFPGLQMPNE